MSEQLGWVPAGPGTVFAGLSLPDGAPRSTGVVLVPPFGWEGVSAHRNLRGWARDLASAGHPVVRYQPPGSGDSDGLMVEQDLESWSAALTDVVAQLRAAVPVSTVTVIGLGLGGLVALVAAAGGAAIEDLVLWATPVKGRLLLRELRAFAALAAEPGQPVEGVPQPLEAVTTDDGVLWVHGYPLGARAQEQLTGLDAAALDLSRVQRALVLGRGTLPHDRTLAQALTDAGADVTTAAGPGYDELTVEPRLSRLPAETTQRVQAWLRPDAGVTGGTGLAFAPTAEERVQLGPVDAVVRRVDGAALTAVFLGAGAITRSGPNRLWTDAARRWADWGIASLRLDLHGIGESDEGPDGFPFGPEGFYDEDYRPELEAALDQAAALGLPERFLLVGLCSGGFWAAQLALHEPRTVGVVVLNAASLVWPPPLMSGHNRKYLTSRETWNRLLHDPRLRQEAAAHARRAAHLALSRLRGTRATELSRSHDVLVRLQAQGTPVAVGASPGEEILEDLDLLGPESTALVRRFAGPPGMHTLATAGLRAQAEELMDEAARAALAAVAAPEVVSRPGA